jgi:hypothetical protein
MFSHDERDPKVDECALKKNEERKRKKEMKREEEGRKTQNGQEGA